MASINLACLTAYFVPGARACEQADNSIRNAGAWESGRGAFAKRRTNLGTGDRISEAVVDSQGFVASLRACRRRRSFGTWLLSEKSRRDAGVMEVRLKSWDMRSLGRFIAAAANMVGRAATVSGRRIAGGQEGTPLLRRAGMSCTYWGKCARSRAAMRDRVAGAERDW